MLFGGLRSRGKEQGDHTKRSQLKRRLLPSVPSPVEDVATLRSRMGLTRSDNSAEKTHKVAPIKVHPTGKRARALIYGPDIDGPADAGEIVWLRVPENGPNQPPVERAILVVGRSMNQELLGLLISPAPEHADEENWFPIGSGQWQPTGEPCWLRLDRIIQVPENWVRRQGALFPERRFERLARVLRERFDWS
ncbi:hypothetical protein C3B44_08835 [Corynebacterium yudongzhengii]|uniref:Type II toxin-antitoxin system PemK/MazF family toxin n=1 Tax=Corynebacterium yudongzhengii TaxID=2080740 RepID=A0A2U1T926_9CORY|nr:type II toxin-antitoxin system PemK/MazF family toxin [Corynebacterium yudongzhengii]AWB82439.1 hypothetical protein C3B44_08835 [Corynebacterium yudongzhengii]PWC02506.1 hypothetical protein DF222_02435 [Corynebacterium yudongzhengii]